MKFARASHISVLLHDFAVGGTERIAIRLANVWVETGRRVSIVCGCAKGPLRSIVDPRVTVIEADPLIAPGVDMRRSLAPKVAALFEVVRPDLIFIPGNYHISMIPPESDPARGRRPRIVVKLSNPIRRDSRSRLQQAVFETLLCHRLRKVDAIVAMSPSLLVEAQAVIRGERAVYIAEPILGDCLPIPRKTHPASCELMAAGRFVKQKDFVLAVEVLALLADTRATLTIYGDGQTLAAVRARAESLGVSARLALPGHSPDFQAKLTTARIFLMTSVYEGYPAVLIEALAAGVPVVATPCSPAVREILHCAELGSISTSRTAWTVAKTVDRVLNQLPGDPGLFTSSVLRHRIGPVSEQYLRLFDQLCA